MLHQLAATIVDTHTSNIRADIVAFVAEMEGGGDGQTSPTTPSNTASSNLSPNGATPDTSADFEAARVSAPAMVRASRTATGLIIEYASGPSWVSSIGDSPPHHARPATRPSP